MNVSKRYEVADTDRFTFGNFPEVMAEVVAIKKRLTHKPPYHKCEMVIAYFRDHSLKMRWLEINPDVASLLVGGEMLSGNIEALFEACKTNRPFLAGYEGYIKQILLDIN